MIPFVCSLAALAMIPVLLILAVVAIFIMALTSHVKSPRIEFKCWKCGAAVEGYQKSEQARFYCQRNNEDDVDWECGMGKARR